MMKNQNKRALRSQVAMAAMAALAVGLLAGCGSDDDGDNDSASGGAGCDNITEPIKIGNISPLSGANAALGALNDQASQIAVKVFNEKNDICGQPIEIDREDDKGDPATALSLSRKMVSNGIELYINTGMGETEDALVPFLMESGATIVGNTGKEELLANDTFFSVLASQTQYSDAVVKQVVAQGWDKVGILDDGTAWSTAHTAGLEEGFEKNGIEVTKIVKYSPSAVDMTTPLKQLQDAGAETMILAGATAIPAVVDGLKQSGWEPHLISWGAYLAYLTPAANLPDTLLEGCTRSLPADQAPDGTDGLDEVAMAILEEGQKELGENNPAVLHATTHYNQLLVYKQAIESAGSTKGTDVASAIEKIKDLPTVWPDMKLTFSADNHTGYPESSFSFCTLALGPYGIPYTSPDAK